MRIKKKSINEQLCAKSDEPLNQNLQDEEMDDDKE